MTNNLKEELLKAAEIAADAFADRQVKLWEKHEGEYADPNFFHDAFMEGARHRLAHPDHEDEADGIRASVKAADRLYERSDAPYLDYYDQEGFEYEGAFDDGDKFMDGLIKEK